MEQRQLLTAVVAPPDARIDGTTGAITAPVPAMPGHTFFVDGGTAPQWNMASAITPNTTNDLILNQAPTDTNYTACCEAGGGSPGNIAVFTDGTMGAGPSDPSATTNVVADLTLPWHATYSLGSNPAGYDITEIDSITGHQDYRTQQHIDIEVQFAGSSNFVSLSGGNGFSFTADATGTLRKGSAQMAIVNSSNPGTSAIVKNVTAIRFDDLPGDPAFFRELVVTGTPSTTTVTGTPAAPSGLTATFDNNSAINLSFTNNANNEQGFLIQRATSAGGPFTTIGTIASAANPGDTITFTDSNISGNTSYFYQVAAFNSNGQATSNVAGPVTIPDIGAEGHYYNVAFWAGNPTVNTKVLSVNYNSGGGSPDPAIRGSNNSTIFTGKVHTDAAGTYTFISNTDDDGYLYVDGQLVSEDPGGHGTRNATSLVPISLAANTSYDFVLLQDQGGGGAGANLLWVEPGGMTPVLVPPTHLSPISDTPQTPTGLAIDSFSNLTPNPNPHAVDFVFDSNNNAVVKYLLQRRPGSSTSESDWTTVNSTDPQGTLQDFNNPGEFTIHIEDASAIPGTSYQYRAIAMNFDANSTPSNVLNVSTPALPAQSPGVEARFFNGELIASPQDPRNLMVNGTPSEFVADTFGVVPGTAPIDANFGNTSPDATNYPDIPRIHVDDFATLFTGKIRTDLAGTYTFVTNSDDDGYMWVNDVLVSSDPGGHGQRNAPNIVPISLAANTEYDFIVMQQERGGGAGIHASWSEPDGMGGSTVLAAIPNNTPGGAGGFEMNMDAPNKQTINATTGAIVTDNGSSAAGNATLSASTTAGGNVISWVDQSFSEVWFQVERSTDGTNFSVIGKAGFDTNSFTDTTATVGNHYFYRVRGMNFDAQGTASNVVDTANGVTLPTPVLTAVGCVPGQAELTIAGQSPNSGGFELQYHDNTSSTFIDVPGAASLPNTTTSYTVTGLDPTKTYTFQARNLAGTGAPNPSPYSAPVSATGAGAPVIDHSTGFAGATDIHTNGNASITTAGTNTVLQVTPNTGSQAGSAFDTTMQGIDAFNTTFDFQFNQGASNPQADGFTFIIQDGGLGQLGGGGGALGYAGMTAKSVAVKFDLWNGGPMDSTTGVYTGGEAVNDALGASPGLLHTGYSMEASGIKFHDNFADTFRANLKYDGTTLTETVTDLTTNAVFTMAYAINIPQIVGSNCAFVGFGGGTGGATAEQDILNWKFTSLAAAHPHLPADFNGDGQQNFADLLILAQNYGAHPATFAMGDANGDGTVNFPDLLILAQNYGKTSAAAPAAAASASSLDLLASARKAKTLARKR